MIYVGYANNGFGAYANYDDDEDRLYSRSTCTGACVCVCFDVSCQILANRKKATVIIYNQRGTTETRHWIHSRTSHLILHTPNLYFFAHHHLRLLARSVARFFSRHLNHFCHHYFVKLRSLFFLHFDGLVFSFSLQCCYKCEAQTCLRYHSICVCFFLFLFAGFGFEYVKTDLVELKKTDYIIYSSLQNASGQNWNCSTRDDVVVFFLAVVSSNWKLVCKRKRNDCYKWILYKELD